MNFSNAFKDFTIKQGTVSYVNSSMIKTKIIIPV